MMGMGMGGSADVRAPAFLYHQIQTSTKPFMSSVFHITSRRNQVSTSDILLIAGFFIAFASVRFGVPMAICWLIGCADRRFLHTDL